MADHLFQMILTVYLSDGEQAVTEVPITPETTCRDVVEFCKEPGESGCHLAEVWRGNGKNWIQLACFLALLSLPPLLLLLWEQRSVSCHVTEREQEVLQVMREGEVI